MGPKSPLVKMIRDSISLAAAKMAVVCYKERPGTRLGF